jgi:hypothetical protein
MSRQLSDGVPPLPCPDRSQASDVVKRAREVKKSSLAAYTPRTKSFYERK